MCWMGLILTVVVLWWRGPKFLLRVRCERGRVLRRRGCRESETASEAKSKDRTSCNQLVKLSTILRECAHPLHESYYFIPLSLDSTPQLPLPTSGRASLRSLSLHLLGLLVADSS